MYRTTAITEDQAHAVDFLGFSISETGAVASTIVEFRDGTVTGALLLAPVTLAASTHATIIFDSTLEVSHADGVFVKTTGAGVVTGVLYERVR
jgi:hypothetical protein